MRRRAGPATRWRASWCARPSSCLHLDLADLVSVRRAAEEVLSGHARLDLLVNNAGVMGTPYRQTADGFELQMATNHLGHFALTGLLLDRIVTTERSRIVTVSSHLHRMGRLRPDDVAGAAFHSTWVAYGTSKLANLLFTAELSRRLQAAGCARSPWRRTRAGPAATWREAAQPSATAACVASSARVAGSTLGQSAAGGALPVLCAATSSSVARASTSARRVSAGSTARRGWRGPRGGPGTRKRPPFCGRHPRN